MLQLKGTLNQKPYLIEKTREHLTVPCLEWLEKETLYPKVFWSPKGSNAQMAGSGLSLYEKGIAEITGPLKLFVGGAPHGNEFPWNTFPETLSFLPKRLYSSAAQSLETFSTTHPELPWDIESFDNSPLGTLPNFDHWEELMEKALENITLGSFQKVLLARIKTLDKPSDFSPFHILKTLLSENLSVFLFMPTKDCCFLGASPEMLFVKKGKKLLVEAVAATRKRTIDEEKSLIEELLTLPKDTLEFSYVKKNIEAILAPLSTHHQWLPQDSVIKTSHLLHRYNRCEAFLKKNYSSCFLIDSLHPTPAIGGFPRKEALQFIQENEPFKRGWYAAPFGLIGEDQSDIAVAIRSLLSIGNRLHLFSGAGIVKGSDTQSEWEELDHKLLAIEKALYADSLL